MVTVKNILGQSVLIDENLNVTGQKELKAAIEQEISEMDIGSITVNQLAFVYYNLEEKGFMVLSEGGDLEPVELPPGAVG